MNKNKWHFSDSKADRSVIKTFESQTNLELPKSYVRLAIESNGATPIMKKFHTQDGTLHIFNYLLDWDKNQKDNIFLTYSSFSVEHEKNIVPFANDPFGNLICFNFIENTKDPSIVYWDHELDEFHLIKNRFEEFIHSLR